MVNIAWVVLMLDPAPAKLANTAGSARLGAGIPARAAGLVAGIPAKTAGLGAGIPAKTAGLGAAIPARLGAGIPARTAGFGTGIFANTAGSGAGIPASTAGLRTGMGWAGVTGITWGVEVNMVVLAAGDMDIADMLTARAAGSGGGIPANTAGSSTGGELAIG